MLSDDGVLVMPIAEQSQMIRIYKHAGTVYRFEELELSSSSFEIIVTNDNIITLKNPQ